MIDSLINFYLNSHVATLFVLGLLAFYFLLINWIFYYRFLILRSWVNKESASLEELLLGAPNVSELSYLSHFTKMKKSLNKELFDLATYSATKDATKGLSFLSIVASTAPFIGLFGTVVSILDTFSHIGQASGTMSVIAAGVSDALVATAGGIFVAIFAYTYHQLLKRKSSDLVGLIRMQGDAVLSRKG